MQLNMSQLTVRRVNTVFLIFPAYQGNHACTDVIALFSALQKTCVTTVQHAA